MVVGIDASLTACAIAIGWETPSLTVLSSEPPKTPGVLGRMLRYDRLVQQVITTIEAEMRNSIHPACVVLEGYSFASPGNSGRWLAEFGGLLRMALTKRWHLHEAPPSSVKQFATGKGNADKMAVALAMQKAFGFEFSGNNVADKYDAAACWLMGCGIAGAPPSEKFSQARKGICEQLVAPKEKPKKKKAKYRPPAGPGETPPYSLLS